MIQQFNTPAPKPRAAAVVFVHGFTGGISGTWSNIPHYLAQEPALSGFDFWGFGFQSRRRLDVLHIWAADARLEDLATELLATPELKSYKSLALVAHSMGGLIVQRALIKSLDLRVRTSHVVLFGTPSNGLGKAGLLAALKQQLNDMNSSGDFIKQLRQDWKDLKLDVMPPFHFLTVAGEIDQFVPPESSLYPFPAKVQAMIPGNHVSMLKADSQLPKPPTVAVLLQQLTTGAAPSGPRNAAALAVERGQFQEAIERLMPHRKDLDGSGAELLALALDAVGRRDDAIGVLEQHDKKGTDALGILAGRYKRRWRLEHLQSDIDRAFELYRQAYRQATAKLPIDCAQAYYHAINLAYLELAANRDLPAAQAMATNVLNYCSDDKSPADTFWRLASEGDALTILGRKPEAIEKHQQAAQAGLSPWQALSIQEQAVRTADLCGWTTDEQNSLAALYSGTAQ